jgi:hypothetical protein
MQCAVPVCAVSIADHLSPICETVFRCLCRSTAVSAVGAVSIADSITFFVCPHPPLSFSPRVAQTRVIFSSLWLSSVCPPHVSVSLCVAPLSPVSLASCLSVYNPFLAEVLSAASLSFVVADAARHSAATCLVGPLLWPQRQAAVQRVAARLRCTVYVACVRPVVSLVVFQ